MPGKEKDVDNVKKNIGDSSGPQHIDAVRMGLTDADVDVDIEKSWRMWKLRVLLVILVGMYVYARLHFRPLDPNDGHEDSWATHSAGQADDLMTQSAPQFSPDDL